MRSAAASAGLHAPAGLHTPRNVLSVLLLGLCPALAVTTTLAAALWMSLALLGVLLASTLVSSLIGLIRAGRAGRARWLLALLVTAAAATGVQLLFEAFAPRAAAALGLCLPVLAVNCLVTCRAELAARGEPPGTALRGSLVDGAVLAGCLVAIAAVREALGSGTLTLFPAFGFSGTLVIPALAAAPARAAVFAAGGFIAAGYLAALGAAVGGRRPGGLRREGRAP